MGIISARGFAEGDPEKLLVGWDSDGRPCGYSGEGWENNPVQDYKYVYWPRILSSYTDINLDETVCVKECPSKESEIECVRPASLSTVLDSDCDVNSIGSSYRRYDSEKYFMSFCLPDPNSAEEQLE